MKQKKNHRTIYDTMREILECVENGIHARTDISKAVKLSPTGLTPYFDKLRINSIIERKTLNYKGHYQVLFYILNNDWREFIASLEASDIKLNGEHKYVSPNPTDIIKLPFERAPIPHNIQGRVISERHSTRTRFKAEWRGIGSSFNIV